MNAPDRELEELRQLADAARIAAGVLPQPQRVAAQLAIQRVEDLVGGMIARIDRLERQRVP